MAEFSEMKALDVWYTVLDIQTLIAGIPDAAVRRRALKRLAKESAKSIAEDIFPKLAHTSGESTVIKDQLPALFHMKGHTPGTVRRDIQQSIASYRASLQPAQQVLLDRFEVKDVAIKVVGVGSVGTRSWVILLTAGEGDPFFLQAKEARSSVMEPFAGRSAYPNHGQRVVNGYRLMQSYSDMFLGWTKSETTGKHGFFRQLRDIKISIQVETFGAAEMDLYAQWCAHALAIGHARSGDSAVISGYLGKGDVFDQAIASFSVAYADQNEKDHAVLKRAIRAGKLKAVVERTT